MSNVPQRIASKHTGRGGRRVLAEQAQLTRANSHMRPRSLLTEHTSAHREPTHRTSGVYDDSPIVDLDAEDDLSVRSMPKVINFSAEVNRSCDGDTIKRNGEFVIIRYIHT